MSSDAMVRPPGFNWISGTFIIGYHVGLLVGLPIYLWSTTPSVSLLAVSAAILFLTQLGIGGAYHRYYAHRGYTLNPVAEGVLLFLATLATQGSALRWSSEHRRHHAFVDTDDDPYSIQKGFWYAHVLWLFERDLPIDRKRVPDLLRNPLVMFQHRHYAWLMVASNVLVFLAVGWALGDFLGAFVIAWWTRLAISHHLTWFINSLAHTWGERTYSREHSAVDNFVIAILTVGEGYHNYHHTFASDYRNGVRWYHFDPTKWMIWTLSKIGLAGNLRRYSEAAIRKRLLVEDRRLLLQKLREESAERRAALEQRVERLAETIRTKLNRLAQLRDQLELMRRERASRGELRRVAARLRELRQSLRADFRNWTQLCGAVLQPA